MCSQFSEFSNSSSPSPSTPEYTSTPEPSLPGSSSAVSSRTAKRKKGNDDFNSFLKKLDVLAEEEKRRNEILERKNEIMEKKNKMIEEMMKQICGSSQKQ